LQVGSPELKAESEKLGLDILLLIVVLVLGVKLRALHMIGKHSTTDLQTQPWSC
jgi:hypothetical protein